MACGSVDLENDRVSNAWHGGWLCAMEPRRKRYGMQSQLVHEVLRWYEIYTIQALYLVEPAHQ